MTAASANREQVLLWLRQVTVMVLKEFPQLLRDRAVFAYMAYIFTIDILISASGASMELHNVKLMVNDEDQSTISRELTYSFQPPYFALTHTTVHPDEALYALDHNAATLYLGIPPDFGKTVLRGDEPAKLQLQVDTSIANVGYLGASYSSRIVAALSNEIASQRLAAIGHGVGSLPQINNQRRIKYNPDIDETWFSSISELLAMITVACIFLPAVAMVREKERGTIEQLLVSPLTPFQIMFSKTLAMMVVMLIGTAISLFAIMELVLKVPVRGSMGLLFVMTALYAFTVAGIGLLAATFSRNSGQLGMLLMLIVFPTIMLSGLWVQFESMPVWLRFVISFMPLHYFIDIAYGILLRGAGIAILWDSVLKMVSIGVILFAIALWRFERQFGR